MVIFKERNCQPGAGKSTTSQAKELGFVEGNRFLPNQPLAREEMASMAAAAVRLGMQTLPEQAVSLDGDRDQADVDEAYLEDIQLMVMLGIMTGTGAEQFSPTREATRAQTAVVLLRAHRQLPC